MNKSQMMNKAILAYKDEVTLLTEQEEERTQDRLAVFAGKLSKIFEVKSIRITDGRFRLGNIELSPNKAGDGVYLVKDCPVCKRARYGPPLYNLAGIGKALTGDIKWNVHYCEKEEKESRTPQEEVYDLICQLLRLLGPEFIQY